MEWVTGIATGLIVAALLWAGERLRRRYWNPVEWRFRRLDGDLWQFRYLGRRTAYVVQIEAGYGGLDGPRAKIQRWDSEWRDYFDMPPGVDVEVRGLLPLTSGPWRMEWIERRGRRAVYFRVLPTRDQIEIRRKLSADPSKGFPGTAE
ncbi:hypothetical protein IT072_03745 [Leifsonia sp. ZF2019]|uniref:hypothetical protein n=1 Tax=Leifsonia sp. ZF2019 TaxID=2781978 RepID=UPI001CBF2637|nr:hypothetical protein [Leifsonia sp. ZF2019]UAJ80171.1 hypothetical protein IT072_03745 [Leifsonia sp. ZF2019]